MMEILGRRCLDAEASRNDLFGSQVVDMAAPSLACPVRHLTERKSDSGAVCGRLASRAGTEEDEMRSASFG